MSKIKRTVATLLVIFGSLTATAKAAENWPALQLLPEWISLAKGQAGAYIARGFVPPIHIENYDPTAPYFDYRVSAYAKSDRRSLDDVGLPTIVQKGEHFYNPLHLAQFALAHYNAHILTGAPYDMMLIALDKLIEIQDEDGALRYQEEFRHYTQPLGYKAGWVSGLAQGTALSAFARGYALTGEQKYLAAGERTLDFLQVKHPFGPMTDLADLDPSLDGYIFFEEYLTDPHVYTLNGFMFTLAGLYDWSQVAKSGEADKLFHEGIRTLVKILPYYDIKAFSAYDLSYITSQARPYLLQRAPHFGTNYHRVHIQLLDLLYSLTGEPVLLNTASRWREYVNQTL